MLKKNKNHEGLPLIAILRGIKPDEVLEHAKVLYEEGFRYIEVPANSPEWPRSVAALQRYFRHKIIIGAGTIITPDDYTLLRNTGARLMISPNVNEELIKKAVNDNMLVCAGALTPTEIMKAIQLGVSMIKIFPAGNLGAPYCKSILSVLPRHIRYFAVGGINANNITDYLKAGCYGAGLGGELHAPGQPVELTKLNAQRYAMLFTKNNIMASITR